MENIDPLGIHTGESIVVAPSQTLTNTGMRMYVHNYVNGVPCILLHDIINKIMTFGLLKSNPSLGV